MAEHAQAWDAMNDEDRLLAISERLDRSYHKIGSELGVSEHVLSRFVRSQGITHGQLKTEYKKRRLRALADRITPYWNTELTTPDIAEKLGVVDSAVGQALRVARSEGDNRFPIRSTGNGLKNNNTPKRTGSKSLRPIGEAFLRECHPDGKKFTPACIIKAHREFPAGFKLRRVSFGISQRDFTNLMQLARVRS